MSAHNIFLSAIILGLFISVSFFSKNFTLGSDFISYYTGASLIKNGQSSRLYHIDQQKKFQEKFPKDTGLILLPFKALPFVALIFLPLSYLDLKSAYLSFAYINISILVLLYFIAKKEFVHISRKRFFLILIYLSPALFLALLNAQTSILLTLVVLLIYVYFKNRRWFIAGLLSGLIIIKVQMITILPFLFILAKNKKKYLLGLVLSLSLLILVSLFTVGLTEFLRFPDFILNTESESYGSILAVSFSLVGLLSPLMQHGLVKINSIFLLNFIFYFFALVFFYLKLKHYPFTKLFIIFSILTILFSIHALAHDLSILTVSTLILSDQYFASAHNKKYLTIVKLLFSLVFFLIIPIVFGIMYNFGPLVLLGIILILLEKPSVNYL